jgi:hypothetical protein
MGKNNAVIKTIVQSGDNSSGKPPPLSCASIHVRGTLQNSGIVFLDKTHEEYECKIGRGVPF